MTRERRTPTRAVSSGEAQQHLRKAHEYLDSARAAQETGAVDACAGNAVLATINAADAVAGVLIGERWQGPHEGAVGHLARGGEEGRAMAVHLRRVLRWKSRAHYDAVAVPWAEAEALLKAAERAVVIAQRVVALLP
jgi:hypothetical protein